MSWKNLPRRKIRYQMYRLRTEAESNGVTKADPPEGLEEFYRGQKNFDGWLRFGDTWDVEKEDPLLAIPRQFSIHEEWNATMRRVVPVLPGLEHMEYRVEDGGES